MNAIGLSMHKLSGAYSDIVDKFIDNASFLWILRSLAVNQPNYSLPDIRQLEQRIDAQLDGLMTAPEQSWQSCLQALQYEEPGEVFTAAVLAFRSGDVEKIQLAVEAGLANDEAEKGLISAMGWLSAELVHGWIKQFLGSKDLNHKYLAIAACSVRRENPGDALDHILQREDCRQHTKLYARALRLIGELKRGDLKTHLQTAVLSDNEEIKFRALWSTVLLGDRSVAAELKPYVFHEGFLQPPAIDLCFRVLPVEEARAWISELGQIEGQIRAVIHSSAVLGDPHAVDWIISKMSQTDVSRCAGEAFSRITGIDIEKNQLALEQAPPGYEEADELAVAEDESLAWPDGDKIKSIWTNHGSHFIAGQRYFMGKAICSDVLKDRLRDASQRERHAAALELALVDAGSALINTRARAR